MNLTGRPVYQKGQRLKKRINNPTKQDRIYWEVVRSLGCIVGPIGCYGRITIHHCGTGMGRQKDHKKIAGLCWGHHLGPQGIDGKCLSKRDWQVKYGTEEQLLMRVEIRLKSLGKNGHG